MTATASVNRKMYDVSQQAERRDLFEARVAMKGLASPGPSEVVEADRGLPGRERKVFICLSTPTSAPSDEQ